ncbi:MULTISPECIES: TonB-dependent receptor domain-containing protein [Chryseobacterium]|uniref:TonB-dependent receptor domain-containing protein n=1 Tax=Chryseobacterium TaxID=59732 RepID=UPI001958AF98|nr:MULTISPECIES: TonB-dependent receptor [Chryseobacterium]MBM7417724.1 outer membrane receptor protein involved in Fe transport [Chryseobacterium sp. JUb44]MDH6211917.1 ferric enterobactin receptor [Chryseobacterium sp. BIGb0186]WSO10550.1 TonB-dependent receptor [Chryseobacterium scophthalmum]
MNSKLWIFILLLFLSFFAKSQEILNAKVSDSIQEKDSVATISEVIIQSSRRDLKLNEGNIVMNVSGNKDFKASTNILEVLRKTPGVTVDSEDGIFIGGRINPAIFINGKPVVMSTQELQSYLRSLSPETVESLEVNTNPSSKYDAEFKGIIDIKLKKNTNLGWIGNYIGNTSVNKFNYKENSLNLSYNTEKISYNVQLGYNNGISTYRYNALQRLANTNVMRTQTYQKDDVEIYTVQMGIDYKLNDKNRFGVNVRGNFRDSERIRLGSLYTVNKDETQLIFNTESKNPINYFQDNYGITADYSFQHKNFKLSFLGNYLSVKNKQEDDFLNSDKPTSQLLSYWKSDLLNKINIYTGQIDISQKIGEATFEAGLKLSDTNTNNMIRYDTLSTNKQFIFDPTRSNQFSYKEKIFAGYWAYSQKFNKLQINAGLRFENTQSISNAVTIDSVVSRNYLKWLPSFSASYAFNKSSELSLSYSRKITRPVFSQLNPFRFYYSPLNYWIGNPYLQPSFTNQIKAAYRYKNWVTAFTIGKETDVMTRYPIYDPKTNVLEFLGTNLPYRNFASLEMNFPIKIAKWWNINTQLAGYYNYELRPYLDEVFALKIYNYEMRLNQIFSLPKGYTLNIFSNYESKTGNSLYIIKSRYTVDISVQKSWLDNKLNMKISFNNIFDSYDQRLEFRHKQIMDTRFTHWWDTQKLILSLSYNFGSSKYLMKNIQKSEEENRAR